MLSPALLIYSYNLYFIVDPLTGLPLPSYAGLYPPPPAPGLLHGPPGADPYAPPPFSYPGAPTSYGQSAAPPPQPPTNNSGLSEKLKSGFGDKSHSPVSSRLQVRRTDGQTDRLICKNIIYDK